MSLTVMTPLSLTSCESQGTGTGLVYSCLLPMSRCDLRKRHLLNETSVPVPLSSASQYQPVNSGKRYIRPKKKKKNPNTSWFSLRAFTLKESRNTQLRFDTRHTLCHTRSKHRTQNSSLDKIEVVT